MNDTDPGAHGVPGTIDLQNRWLSLLAHYGIGPARARPLWHGILQAYGEPQRHYHTLKHIAQMLTVADRLRDLATDPWAVELAIWLHDLVYDPRRSDNEEQSAELAGAQLTALELSPETVSRIQTLILATKDHQAEGDPDTAVLIDADLAGLAAPWETFAEQGNEIAQEYAHLPAAVYRAARARVLRSFLDRPQIYQTEAMRQCCQVAARRNLARAIAELEAGNHDP